MRISISILLLLLVIWATPTVGQVCYCPGASSPICGSDWQTYADICQFQCYQKHNPSLHILSYARCSEYYHSLGLDTNDYQYTRSGDAGHDFNGVVEQDRTGVDSANVLSAYTLPTSHYYYQYGVPGQVKSEQYVLSGANGPNADQGINQQQAEYVSGYSNASPQLYAKSLSGKSGVEYNNEASLDANRLGYLGTHSTGSIIGKGQYLPQTISQRGAENSLNPLSGLQYSYKSDPLQFVSQNVKFRGGYGNNSNHPLLNPQNHDGRTGYSYISSYNTNGVPVIYSQSVNFRHGYGYNTEAPEVVSQTVEDKTDPIQVSPQNDANRAGFGYSNLQPQLYAQNLYNNLRYSYGYSKTPQFYLRPGNKIPQNPLAELVLNGAAQVNPQNVPLGVEYTSNVQPDLLTNGVPRVIEQPVDQKTGYAYSVVPGLADGYQVDPQNLEQKNGYLYNVLPDSNAYVSGVPAVNPQPVEQRNGYTYIYSNQLPASANGFELGPQLYQPQLSREADPSTDELFENVPTDYLGVKTLIPQLRRILEQVDVKNNTDIASQIDPAPLQLLIDEGQSVGPDNDSHSIPLGHTIDESAERHDVDPKDSTPDGPTFVGPSVQTFPSPVIAELAAPVPVITEATLHGPILSVPKLPEPALAEPILVGTALPEPALNEANLGGSISGVPKFLEPALVEPTLVGSALSVPALNEATLTVPQSGVLTFPEPFARPEVDESTLPVSTLAEPLSEESTLVRSKLPGPISNAAVVTAPNLRVPISAELEELDPEPGHRDEPLLDTPHPFSQELNDEKDGLKSRVIVTPNSEFSPVAVITRNLAPEQVSNLVDPNEKLKLDPSHVEIEGGLPVNTPSHETPVGNLVTTEHSLVHPAEETFIVKRTDPAVKVFSQNLPPSLPELSGKVEYIKFIKGPLGKLALKKQQHGDVTLVLPEGKAAEQNVEYRGDQGEYPGEIRTGNRQYKSWVSPVKIPDDITKYRIGHVDPLFHETVTYGKWQPHYYLQEDNGVQAQSSKNGETQYVTYRVALPAGSSYTENEQILRSAVKVEEEAYYPHNYPYSDPSFDPASRKGYSLVQIANPNVSTFKKSSGISYRILPPLFSNGVRTVNAPTTYQVPSGLSLNPNVYTSPSIEPVVSPKLES